MRVLRRGQGLRCRDPSEFNGCDQQAQFRSLSDLAIRPEGRSGQNASTDFAETPIAERRGSALRVSGLPRAPDDFRQDLPRVRRRRRNGLTQVAVAFVALVLLAFGVVVLAAAQSEDTPLQTAHLEVPPPQWIDIVRPIEIFGLDAPELAKNTKVYYRARRHREWDGRQDMLGFGQLRGKDLFLRLMVYRIGSEAAPQVSFMSTSPAAPRRRNFQLGAVRSHRSARRDSVLSKLPISTSSKRRARPRPASAFAVRRSMRPSDSSVLLAAPATSLCRDQASSVSSSDWT